MNKLKDESITDLVKGIKKDADEILCPLEDPDKAAIMDVLYEQEMEGDDGEQSRDEIARDENSIIDNQERG